MINKIEAPLFGSRWLLYPINLGLIVALAVYVLRFIIDDYELVSHGLSFDTETIMVSVLGLIDTAMVANLLVMVIQGSHQIFIRKFSSISNKDRPQWLEHIDSGILKVKLSLSVAGITLVQLLKDFVNMEHIIWDVAVHRMIAHMVCLISAIFMAIIWRITHPSGSVPANHLELTNNNTKEIH